MATAAKDCFHRDAFTTRDVPRPKDLIAGRETGSTSEDVMETGVGMTIF
jgi:hypothetical protein